MPAALHAEWEKVRNLIASVNRNRAEPRILRKQDIARLTPLLESIDIGPILKIYEVPPEIPRSLAGHVCSPNRREALLAQASSLVIAATPDRALQSLMSIRMGSIPPLDSPGDAFWHGVFRQAGLIARRTVAALVLTPQAAWAFDQAGTSDLARSFVANLRRCTTE
jgi:hypothetical protein